MFAKICFGFAYFASLISEKKCEILRKSLRKTNKNVRIFSENVSFIANPKHAWFTTVPLKYFLINNMEDVVVVQAGKVFNSNSFLYNFFLREATIKKNQFLQIFLTLKFWKKIKIINYRASNRKMYLPLLSVR